MYFDMSYIVLVLPAILFSMYASFKVKSTFNKYSNVYSNSNMTGYEAARRILDANGLYDIQIEHISGSLTDHYDPAANVIRLSDSVYQSTSTAAIGVAGHEAGHAVQHAVGYTPIKIRSAIIPVTNFASRLSTPLILIGLLFSNTVLINLAYLGIIAFCVSLLFQLVTLPTEFNASRRALNALDRYGILSSNELRCTKKVLSAAAMTYVAALAVSVTQLLRLLLIVSGRGGRRRR